MRNRLYRIIASLICSIFAQVVLAQETPQLFSIHQRDQSMSDFVYQIEKQTSYHFYYDPGQTDSLRITIDVTQEPLDVVLSTAFANTGLFYYLDDHNNIFVTPVPLKEGAAAPQIAAKRNQAKPAVGDIKFSRTTNSSVAVVDNRVYVIGNPSNSNPATLTVSGFVRVARTGEPVVGASVYTENTHTGVSTDQYGYFILSLRAGRHALHVESIGMRDVARQIQLRGEGKMNIEMESQEQTLKNVIVSAQKLSNVKSMQLGAQRLDIKTIKQVPVVFGEADLLRVLLTLPGVKSVGEASTGLNVRGGSADQNLVLFNDATIFNPAHFFGLFSAFNPEVVKDVELYKASIPARFGGRLSSVLNISSREGNKKEFAGSAGIGLLTSRLNIEGPLIKDKTSFILGGRTTYADWLLKKLPDEYKNSRASFYDLNLDISHEINKKNNLYLTGYISNDRFNLNSDTVYNYKNQNLSLKWKHIFNSKFYGTLTGGLDRYAYSIGSTVNPVDAYKLNFNVNQAYIKANFNYYINAQHSVEFGLSSIEYNLHPGSYQPVGKQSIVVPDVVAKEKGLESAVYVSDRWTISPVFSAEGGIRYSMFNYLGPQSVNLYPENVPKTEDNIIGTKSYGNNQVIKTYSAPEYRISFKYMISDSFSIKAGYNTQRQYIHVLSNTAAIAPTDIWKLSDPNIRPQQGDQISLGLFKNFRDNTIETSVEVYYKHIEHYLDYKSGAQLVLNHHIETDVLNTKGKAYGVELLIKKLTGKLNGWISYTYSRTLLKQDDAYAGELINGGHFYPANYDKPHDITVISNYRVNHRFSVSINGTYSTGRPITLPTGVFYYSGSYRTLYADRNAYRIPDYFRMDFGMNIEGNHRVHQLTHNSWTIGVYNFTARKNPYSVYYVSQNGAVNGYKLSIFGTAIPYVNFNIRF